MRVASVARVKGELSCNGRTQKLPREGTQIRAIYDTFMANRGKVIDWYHPRSRHSAIDYLINYYGLDLRCVAPKKWILAGEWIQGRYVDYAPDLRLGPRPDVMSKSGLPRSSSLRQSVSC